MGKSVEKERGVPRYRLKTTRRWNWTRVAVGVTTTASCVATTSGILCKAILYKISSWLSFFPPSQTTMHRALKPLRGSACGNWPPRLPTWRMLPSATVSSSASSQGKTGSPGTERGEKMAPDTFQGAKRGSFFQPMPQLYNTFVEDPFLRHYLKRVMPQEVRREAGDCCWSDSSW